MTLNQAIAKAGSREALALLLGVTARNTYRWDREIPKQRLWQLQVLRPEWFRKGGK